MLLRSFFVSSSIDLAATTENKRSWSEGEAKDERRFNGKRTESNRTPIRENLSAVYAIPLNFVSVLLCLLVVVKRKEYYHKDAIQDIFDINIECDRKNGYKYYIENDEVLHEDSVQNWLLSTMSVNDIISQSKVLHDRILLQQVPCSSHLDLFIQAMKQNVRVMMSYQRYGSQYITSVICEPYCLKLFNQRWYVLAHFHRDATPDKPERDYYGVYAFDRIHSLKLTDVKFKVRQDFNSQLFFSECFGVVAGDGTKAERVVLRAYGKQRFYLNDLPLHPSQRLIADTEEYAEYTYYLRPTYDFCAHLLSLAGQVQVVTPQSLADRICQMARPSAPMWH